MDERVLPGTWFRKMIAEPASADPGRKHCQEQHDPARYIGGHLMVPYEQYTQLSPTFGIMTVLQYRHS